jgi:hypothetical protein
MDAELEGACNQCRGFQRVPLIEGCCAPCRARATGRAQRVRFPVPPALAAVLGVSQGRLAVAQVQMRREPEWAGYIVEVIGVPCEVAAIWPDTRADGSPAIAFDRGADPDPLNWLALWPDPGRPARGWQILGLVAERSRVYCPQPPTYLERLSSAAGHQEQAVRAFPTTRKTDADAAFSRAWRGLELLGACVPRGRPLQSGKKLATYNSFVATCHDAYSTVDRQGWKHKLLEATDEWLADILGCSTTTLYERLGEFREQGIFITLDDIRHRRL